MKFKKTNKRKESKYVIKSPKNHKQEFDPKVRVIDLTLDNLKMLA